MSAVAQPAVRPGRRRLALGFALLLAVGGAFVDARAAGRPVTIGEGLGYAVLPGSFGDESPYVHGREFHVFARFRHSPAHLQPRVDFTSQSFDLDASRLTQLAVEPQVIGGDRRVRAGLAGLQWSFGPARPVRAYVVAEGGYSWARERTLDSDARRFSGADGRWMASAGAGLEARFGAYGAFVEGRRSHRYEAADAFFPTHPWSMTAGLVF